jgi:multiple sugar transport system substrate-binding protein
MRGVAGRSTSVLLVAAVLGAALSGCGDDRAGGQVTLRFVWWGNEDRAEVTRNAVDEFQRRNPEIKVETEYSGYDPYFQKLSTQVAGGTSPDLLQLDRPTLGEYAKRNVLADLGEHAGKSLRVDRISSNLLAGGKVDGKQYAIAAGQTTQALIHDPALFAAAGATAPTEAGQSWTWAQFAEAMNRIGAQGAVTGTTDPGWAVDWFEVWLRQNGKQLYTEDGKLGFEAADLERYWTMFGQLRATKGVTPPEVTTKQDGGLQNSGMVTRKAASEVGYDSSLTGYFSTYGQSLKTAPLPSDNASEPGMAALPPVSFAVSQRSKHKEAAVKLLDFLLNDPDAGKVLGAARGVPPNEDIRAQVCASATGGNKLVCDHQTAQKDKMGPAFGPWPSGSSAIKRDFQRTYDDVIFKRANVGDAARRVVQDAKLSLGY